MPIPGITDRRRLTRLGKIRLGRKKPGQRGDYPVAEDHFVFVDAPAVEQKYGDRCQSIYPVLLPMNAIGEFTDPVSGSKSWDLSGFWRTERASWGRGTGKFCSCDHRSGIAAETGEIAYAARRVWRGKDERTGKAADVQGESWLKQINAIDEIDPGEIFELPCPGHECPYYQRKLCKDVGTLDMYLPTVQGRGVWTIQTSSYHSIQRIESSLQSLADDMNGHLTGVPFVLNLVPYEAQVEGKKKTVFVLELICPLNIQQLAGLRRKAVTGGLSTLDSVGELMPASDPMPDDLMPKGGEVLDRALAAHVEAVGGDDEPPPPADEPPPLSDEDAPPASTRDRIRKKTAPRESKAAPAAAPKPQAAGAPDLEF